MTIPEGGLTTVERWGIFYGTSWHFGAGENQASPGVKSRIYEGGLAVLGLHGPKGPTGSSPGRDACGDSSGGGTVREDWSTSHGSMKQEGVRGRKFHGFRNGRPMKKGIHPEYVVARVICACGHTFVTRSTKPEIRVEICSKCHPFFTGQQKYVDTEGRIDRFKRKYGQYIPTASSTE